MGRKSIDPIVLVKIHILKFLFNEYSLRKTYENLKYNILYRWFIGYNLGEKAIENIILKNMNLHLMNIITFIYAQMVKI